ncbi:hypothetical protein [Zavarzinella formosa]|uniref:hypothetical protein n=1 Tax=Zavarzinella formosa TaxID=360055 RepID=UPI0003001CCA|nr:hypothetical protein [Zavarzinella formosa]
MNNEPPPDIDGITEKLGPFVALYPGNMLNVIAGFIVGPLMILAGIGGTGFLIWYALTEEHFDARVLKALVFPFVAVFGWVTLRWAYNNRKTRIIVCKDGLAFEHPKGIRWFPYEDITEVKQTRIQDGRDENDRPFMNRETKFTIKATDGSELEVTPNLVNKHLTLMRLVYDKTRTHGTKWTLVKA